MPTSVSKLTLKGTFSEYFVPASYALRSSSNTSASSIGSNIHCTYDRLFKGTMPSYDLRLFALNWSSMAKITDILVDASPNYAVHSNIYVADLGTSVHVLYSVGMSSYLKAYNWDGASYTHVTTNTWNVSYLQGDGTLLYTVRGSYPTRTMFALSWDGASYTTEATYNDGTADWDAVVNLKGIYRWDSSTNSWIKHFSGTAAVSKVSATTAYTMALRSGYDIYYGQSGTGPAAQSHPDSFGTYYYESYTGTSASSPYQTIYVRKWLAESGPDSGSFEKTPDVQFIEGS